MKEPIHMIADYGGFIRPSKTICGRVGQRVKADSTSYRTASKGEFIAVTSADLTQGATCEKCKTIIRTKKSPSRK